MRENSQNLSYIKVFLIVVAIAAIVSLSYRTFLMFKNSSFKYDTFNLLVISDHAYLAHIDRSEEKVVVLKFMSLPSNFPKQNKISQSLTIGAPVDGVISVGKNSGLDLDANFMNRAMTTRLLTNIARYRFEGVNDLDIVKIFLVVNHAQSGSRKALIVDKPSDTALERYDLSDKQIFNQKISIQVTNSTEIDGLGSKVSTMLKNAGYNVVSTNNGTDKVSIIKSGDLNGESVRRLKEIFNTAVTPANNNSIADVVVVLGKDFAGKIDY